MPRARRKGLLPVGIIALFTSRWTGNWRFPWESNVKLWRLVTELSKHRVAGPARITELTCIPMSAGKARNIKRMQRSELVFQVSFSVSFGSHLLAAHQARLKMQCPYADAAPRRNSPTFSRVSQWDPDTLPDTGEVFPSGMPYLARTTISERVIYDQIQKVWYLIRYRKWTHDTQRYIEKSAYLSLLVSICAKIYIRYFSWIFYIFGWDKKDTIKGFGKSRVSRTKELIFSPSVF